MDEEGGGGEEGQLERARKRKKETRKKCPTGKDWEGNDEPGLFRICHQQIQHCHRHCDSTDSTVTLTHNHSLSQHSSTDLSVCPSTHYCVSLSSESSPLRHLPFFLIKVALRICSVLL